LIGLSLAGFLLLAPHSWSQPGSKSGSDPAKAAYEQAKQKEESGDLLGAIERYRIVTEDYPTSEWAGIAGERIQAITGRLSAGARPPTALLAVGYILNLVYWLVGLLILGGLFGFFGWRAGWFWEWALLARVTESVDASFLRFRSRKRLLRELEARKANPRDGRARHALGVMYYQGRRFDLAAEELTHAVALDPDRVDAQYHLGLSYLRLNRPQEALGPLGMVVAQKPTHGGDAMVRLAQAKLATGDPAGTEALCREAVAKMPTDPEARYYLALSLDAQGKREEAPALLQEAISLGRAARGTRCREALNAARRAKAYLRSRRAS